MKKSIKQRALDFAGDRTQGAGHGYPSWEANLIEKGYIKGAKDQAKTMYSEDEIKDLVQSIINEIEIRKQNIISNSEKMTIHLLEGGCIAFESSQDVIKECFEQFKKK